MIVPEGENGTPVDVSGRRAAIGTVVLFLLGAAAASATAAPGRQTQRFALSATRSISFGVSARTATDYLRVRRCCASR
jgi:hypothetical protein